MCPMSAALKFQNSHNVCADWVRYAAQGIHLHSAWVSKSCSCLYSCLVWILRPSMSVMVSRLILNLYIFSWKFFSSQTLAYLWYTCTLYILYFGLSVICTYDSVAWDPATLTRERIVLSPRLYPWKHASSTLRKWGLIYQCPSTRVMQAPAVAFRSVTCAPFILKSDKLFCSMSSFICSKSCHLDGALWFWSVIKITMTDCSERCNTCKIKLLISQNNIFCRLLSPSQCAHLNTMCQTESYALQVGYPM